MLEEAKRHDLKIRIIKIIKELYYFLADMFVPDFGPMSRKLVKILNHEEDRKIYLIATEEMRRNNIKRKTIILSNGDKLTIEIDIDI